MADKIAAVAGATAGWGGAGALIFTGDTTQDVLAQAFLLAMGIAGTAWLMLCARSRPMKASFELGRAEGRSEGYQEGRSDALAEMGGGRVIRLRERTLEERRFSI